MSIDEIKQELRNGVMPSRERMSKLLDDHDRLQSDNEMLVSYNGDLTPVVTQAQLALLDILETRHCGRDIWANCISAWDLNRLAEELHAAPSRKE